MEYRKGKEKEEIVRIGELERERERERRRECMVRVSQGSCLRETE